MEEPNFNPNPAPTAAPEPAPEPTPSAPVEATAPAEDNQTVEPVPDDSFAQPAAEGESWQPSQATAPQVGGMDNPQSASVAAPTKKKHTGLIIGIAVTAVALIGVVIAIVIVLVSSNASKPTKKEESEEEVAARELKKRDTRRQDDIARFLTAVNDYQTNNSGKTPFGDGTWDGKAVNSFIRRYIDSDVKENSRYIAGTSAACDAEKCKQFTDPDGTMYGFDVTKASASSQSKTNITVPGLSKKVDHIVHVVVNAGCGSQDGTYDVGTGIRQIAMFYTLENGSVYCNDNH